MDFNFTKDQEQFRKDVHNFLEEQIKKGVFSPTVDAWILTENDDFTRNVAQKGWIGMTWPKQYGGKGYTYVDRLIFFEEMMRHGAPMGFLTGDRQIGPAIMAHGSEEQKQYFLPKIISGEIRFALGMSEPEAGSDLGGLKTQAVEHDDCFIINGQKVWTSNASRADYIYMVARTNFDPNVSKSRSISEFIVDRKTPGITVRQLTDITGGDHWAEVFFDDVHIPKSAMVGKKDYGFYQIVSQLDFERSGIERLMSNYILFDEIIKYARETKQNRTPLCKEPSIRNALADLIIKFEAGKLLFYRVAWAIDQGEKERQNLTKYTSMAKVFGNEFEQELDNIAINIVGLRGLLVKDSKAAVLNGMTTKAYLFSPAHSIQAGTHEIMLNLLASRGLGLPKE